MKLASIKDMPCPMLKSFFFLLTLCPLLFACAPRWDPPPGYRGGFLVGSPPPERVVVNDGDSVYLIARRFNVPMRAIIEVNRLSPPYVLYPGQILRLVRPTIHTVVSGDSLYAISRRYGVDMRAIAQANTIKSPYTIYPGQKLSIAASYTSSTLAMQGSQVTAKAALPPRSSRSRSQSSGVQSIPSRPAPPLRAGGRFEWPVKGRLISEFGPAGKGLHNDGINIAVSVGTAVRAAENGIVAYSGNELQGFGNLLLIKHADGWMSAYAHNKELLVARGDKVQKGQIITRSGDSGSVRSPQLHFELRRGTKAVNPLEHMTSRQS